MFGKAMGGAFALAITVSMSSGAALGGEIKIGGTGAAFGVAQLLGEAFSASYPGETVEVVPSLGSSGGIQAVSAGAIQLSFSGRELKPDERAKGLQQLPFLDSPFVFVSSHARPQKLTKADVVAIYDGTLLKWPDGKDISPVLRPKGDSDTSFIVSNIKGSEAALEKLRQRSDVPIGGTDQDNMEIAEKIPNSFAGSTLTQIVTEKPRVRVITLDGVEPTVERMEKGEYPLRKKIYLITQADLSPLAQKFVAFLRSPEADRIIRENGGLVPSTRTAAAE